MEQNQSQESMPGEKQPLKIEYCKKCGFTLKGGICIKCAERDKDLIKVNAEKKQIEIIELGGLRAYEDFTLEKFDNTELKKACIGFPTCNLFLYGSAGTGKTHLATGIIRKFPPFKCTKPQEIYRRLRNFKKEKDSAILTEHINIRCLLIDDLGTEKTTDFSFSATYEIIDGRWMAKKGGLIITSNLSIDELAQRLGDDRIPSRIAGSFRIIRLEGRDRRLK